jgi:hypothetical protein
MTDEKEVVFTPDFEVETDEEYTVEFMPGCFDEFEGTQEELDQFIEDLNKMVASGELFKNSRPLTDEEAEELIEFNNKKLQ